MALPHIHRFISKARNIVTVEPVFFLYMLGSFLQFVSVQHLIYYKVCIIKYNDSIICNNLSHYKTEEAEVTTQASHWLIMLNAALTFPSVLSSLFLGSWSDKVGRKIIILLPTCGTIIYCGILIVSAKYIQSSVWLIIGGQAILGATGAFVIMTSAVFSYIGDITTKENRTLRFSILESMMFMGSFVGLIVSGILIDNAGYIAVFVCVMSCEIVIILYTFLWLKESVSQYGRQGISERLEHSVVADLGEVDKSNRCIQLLTVRHVIEAFTTVFCERPQRRRHQILLLVICLFIYELVGTGENDTTTYYLKKDPLGWNSTLIGFYLGGKNLAKGLALVIVLPILQLLGAGDAVIASGCTVLRLMGFVLMAFARNNIQMFSVIVFMAFGGIPAACTRAMLSKLVSSSEQGSLFSFTAAMETTTTFLGSLIFNALFPATLDIIQGGFIYLLMAGLLVVPVILLIWVRDLKKSDSTYQIQEEDSPQAEEYKMSSDASLA